MKKLLIIIAGIGILAVFAWQFILAPKPVPQVTITNPTGPVVVPVLGIDSGNVTNEEFEVGITYWKNIDEAVAYLAADQAEFAVLPITTAANIYAQGIDITLLGVHEWKVFYLVAKEGVEFKDWSSLIGKTVYSAHGKGQTVDILMRAALSKIGVDPDRDVEILYAPPQEAVALFKAGKADFVALPEPFITLALKDSGGRLVLDFQEYYKELSGKKDRIPVAGLFVKKDFLKEHPEQAARVADLLARSTEWGNQNVDTALPLAGEVLPIPAPVMKEALTRIDFYYVPIAEARAEVEEFLRITKELYPEGITELPDQGFYAQ
jgi:NitT/TauT family transport system substrate-binding protein